MEESLFERGMKIRRRVLGDQHVDRSWSRSTAFDEDFQRQITEAAWGSAWSRPGLDLKTRHMITIAVLAALGRVEELTLHIQASPNTGITREEMRELLMQVAPYAGIPAANTAFGIARKLYAGQDESGTGP